MHPADLFRRRPGRLAPVKIQEFLGFQPCQDCPQAVGAFRMPLARIMGETGGMGKQGGCHEAFRSEEHTSELQSLMRISYAVFCLKKKKNIQLLLTKHRT